MPFLYQFSENPLNWFKPRAQLSLVELNRILIQTKDDRKRRLTDLEDLELDTVYFYLQKQIQWIEALQLDISSLTDPSWSIADEIKFTDTCNDPLRELCTCSLPTSRMIRIEQLLNEDTHFIKQTVYQEIRQVVLNLLTPVADPNNVLDRLKHKLKRYLMKRFRLPSSTTLALVVKQYIHAKIGVLPMFQSSSIAKTSLMQRRMKPSNVYARSLFDLQGQRAPKLGRTLNRLAQLCILMPSAALKDWNDIVHLVQEETYCHEENDLIVSLAFALTQVHDFNIIHLLFSFPARDAAYLTRLEAFIVQKTLH